MRRRAAPGRAREVGRRVAALLPLVVAAACAGGAASPPGIGTWVGRLHTVAGTCPDGQDSDLVVGADAVTFVPGDGVLSLRGPAPTADGAIHAQRLGTDINRKPLPMVFDGHVQPGPDGGGGIDGTYGTPTCRATVSLHRPTHSALQRLLGD